MSSAIDKALMAMSLDEEDLPFDMPNLPEFSSAENNAFSLIGRILNPDCQKVSDVVLDMPRKWQKVGKVRGVALTDERFQFIFSHEHDLEEILDKCVQTHNQWALVLQKWEEKLPPDFLQLIPLWVQIKNIHVNHYTVEAITALGELVGLVKEVAFDPAKSQSKGYVRVKILFDVSKPLRKSKIVNMPSGEKATILYNYERVQKICFTCQRLSHEQTKCPLFLKFQQSTEGGGNNCNGKEGQEKEPIIKDTDPLYGVLEENQVGINPNTDRPKIAPEVLEGMRQYLMVVNGPERLIREDRVKSSLRSIGNDILAQKSMLSLEPILIVSKELNKGKGIVFNFENLEERCKEPKRKEASKLLSASIQAARNQQSRPDMVESTSDKIMDFMVSLQSPASTYPTVYGEGLYEASPSGTRLNPKAVRKRPYVKKRNLKGKEACLHEKSVVIKKELKGVGAFKRKAVSELDELHRAVKRKAVEVVPNQGSPNHQ